MVTMNLHNQLPGNDLLPDHRRLGFPTEKESGRLFLPASSPRSGSRNIRGSENKPLKILGPNKKVAVVGLGVEGLSSVRWFLGHKAAVTVLDRKPYSDFPKDIWRQADFSQVDLRLGGDYLSDLDGFDMIIRSPSVRPDLEPLIEARKNKVLITSQSKLFFDLCPAPIIGVTGTKGKGTTATLIAQILQAAGHRVFLGGNIGNPPLDFIDKVEKNDWVVLELSSFQLMDLEKSPHIAVVLMITSEHLDWHNDVGEYRQAKMSVTRYQKSTDFAIIAQDYPHSRPFAAQTKARVFFYSRNQKVTPGTYIEKGVFWFEDDRVRESIIPTSNIQLAGRHNWENVAAALTVAKIIGVELGVIVKTIAQFRGLEYRLEKIAEIKGVKYYNDSFSTTPETAIAAIEAFDQPEILILGGSSKGSDFTRLGQVICEASNIKAIIGIGAEWPRIKNSITCQLSKTRIIEGRADMEQIVKAAYSVAEAGDVVILSPGCASFDMFVNYKHRGGEFKKYVQALSS